VHKAARLKPCGLSSGSWAANGTQERGTSLYAPVFPNQLLAVACAASDTTRVDARENLMLLCCAEVGGVSISINELKTRVEC
jgi:hypothetical protein